ncbi:MAG: PhoH family protein, partial [Caldimonas sp.]
MPLPKPPAKRAALLSADDFDAQAAPQHGRRSQKSRTAAEPASPPLLELYDEVAPGVATPPAVVAPPSAA